MRILFSLILTLSCFSVFSQTYIEPCRFGQPLVDALDFNYSPSSTLGYGPARDVMYSMIDNVGNDLSGIYSGFTITLDPSQDPSSDAFDKGINAEHVYPQSLGAGDEPQRSDIHNIFPCRVEVNSARGSCAFGEIVDIDSENWFYLDMVQSATPTENIDLYSEKDTEDCRWEPREDKQGDIARAMFYFYTIYQAEALAESSSFFNQQKQTLLEWHLGDPPDAIEIERNEEIQQAQGNYNPFILDSTLAHRAYFMPDAEYDPGSEGCIDVMTSLNEQKFLQNIQVGYSSISESVIVNTDIQQLSFTIYTIDGKLVKQGLLNSNQNIEVNNLPFGVHILVLQKENKLKSFKFFKP